MPPQLQDNRTGHPASPPIHSKRELAATAKFGRSPQLIRAIPSSFDKNLPWYYGWLARGMALVVPCLFYLGPFLWSLPLALLPFRPKAAGALLALDITLAVAPHRPWPALRKWFQLWFSLYNVHHNLQVTADNPCKAITNDVENTSVLIMATHPHGVIPIHGYLWAAFCDQYLPPDRYGFCAITSLALRLPFLRQLMLWLSTDEATKSVLVQRLTTRQDSLYVLPGGVAEIFLAQRGNAHQIFCQTPRPGLMKVALETGALLVPTFVFGATDFFHQLATYRHTSTPSAKGALPFNRFGALQQKLSRRYFRGGFTFFWGQYGLPLPFEDVQCSMVFGDPIEPLPGTLGHHSGPDKKQTCLAVAKPTPAQVHDLQERYTHALLNLFEQYKAQAGYPDAELIFV